MAHFFALRDQLDDSAKVFFAMMQCASDLSAGEKQAAIKIQSNWRGSKVRERWHTVLHNACLVQRISRGWLARVRTRAKRAEKLSRLNAVFFHHCACIIQKFFRGWSSRKHLHDYHGRKRYLQTVEKRGEWTKEYLGRYRENKEIEAKMQEETQMQQEFTNLAGELHHLVSTKSIAGVYNPPYNDMLPRAFNKPIEQHLRDACHVRLPQSLRRPKLKGTLPSLKGNGYPGDAAMHAGPPQDLPDRDPYESRTANVGRMQKIQGPFRSKEQIEIANAKATNLFRSIQSSSVYSAVEDDQRLNSKLSKLTRVSPADFNPGGSQPNLNPPPSSVHATAPFKDRPHEMRSDYTELPKIRDKPPFFTAMPRDKHFHDYNDQGLLPNGSI